MLVFVSCGKDEPDSGTPESIVPTGEGKMDLLSPQAQAGFLAETAGMVEASLNQEAIGQMVAEATYFNETYGSLMAPAQWRETGLKILENIGKGIDIEDFFPVNPREFLKDAAYGTANMNALALTRSSFNIIDSFTFSDLSGIYEPGDGEWVKTGDSKKIEFRFNCAEGGPLCFTVSSSEETFVYSFNEEEWKGNDVYYTTTVLNIPTKAEAVYEAGGIPFARTEVEYSIDKKANGTMDIKATATASAAGMDAKLELSVTDRRLEARHTLSSGGKHLCDGIAEANGNHMTDLMHIVSLKKPEDALLLINEGAACVDILGRVQINTKIRTTDKFFGLHFILDNLSGITQEEAVAEIDRSANILNGYTDTYVRYNGTETVQARLKWGHKTDEKDGLWICTVSPLISFPSDGTVIPVSTLLESLLGSGASSIPVTVAERFGRY